MKYSIYQEQNPEFLNNYLNYKRCIEHCSNTTVREDYFDIRTFFRYLKLKEQNPKEFNIEAEGSRNGRFSKFKSNF